MSRHKKSPGEPLRRGKILPRHCFAPVFVPFSALFIGGLNIQSPGQNQRDAQSAWLPLTSATLLRRASGVCLWTSSLSDIVGRRQTFDAVDASTMPQERRNALILIVAANGDHCNGRESGESEATGDRRNRSLTGSTEDSRFSLVLGKISP